MKPRIGVYSGTFDPIHPGHTAFAEEAMRMCNLDEVIFTPELKPRGKAHVTDIAHRIAMIECATSTVAGLRVMRLASDQFTVKQTLPELQQKFGDDLTLLVGSDVIRTFPYRWEGLATLLADVSLAIGMRSRDSPDEVTEILEQLQRSFGIKVHYTLISTPEADIASSHIRNGTADVARLYPGMLAYMHEHQLYTQALRHVRTDGEV